MHAFGAYDPPILTPRPAHGP